MKNVLSVFLFVLLFAPAAALAQAQEHYQHSAVPGSHAEWLQCQTDDDCVIVFGPTCNYQFAVNKMYADQARAANIKILCQRPIIYPGGVIPKCIVNECVIAIPTLNQPNATSPPKASQ